jgi:flagellar biosynthesis protein FlhB
MMVRFLFSSFERRTTLKRLSPVTGLKRFNVVRRLLLLLCSILRIRDLFL